MDEVRSDGSVVAQEPPGITELLASIERHTEAGTLVWSRHPDGAGGNEWSLGGPRWEVEICEGSADEDLMLSAHLYRDGTRARMHGGNTDQLRRIIESAKKQEVLWATQAITSALQELIEGAESPPPPAPAPKSTPEPRPGLLSRLRDWARGTAA